MIVMGLIILFLSADIWLGRHITRKIRGSNPYDINLKYETKESYKNHMNAVRNWCLICFLIRLVIPILVLSFITIYELRLNLIISLLVIIAITTLFELITMYKLWRNRNCWGKLIPFSSQK